MAIRRRRKTLTNLISSMEARVTSVELRPINLLTTAQIASALADEDPALDGGPDTVVGLTAPNQYKRVVGGYYYAARLTGTKPRVELYFSADPGISTGETIRVSGIYKLSGVTPELDITNDYKTISVDTPPWTDGNRPGSFGGKRHTPGNDVTQAVLFQVSSGTEFSDRKTFVTTRRIDSVEATTTTAKITFNSTNYFKAGDVISIDMPSDSVYYGIDGLFTVKEAGANYITYDFSTALDEPINSSAITEERYVYAVAQSAVRNGATYIDTSTDPDTVYVWKDIRWVTYSTGDVTKDSIAPSPVTGLEGSDENETPAGSAVGASRVKLIWDAPTTNVNGKPLDDLIGYTVWWRQYQTQDWAKSDMTGVDTDWSRGGFEQGEPAYFRVYARDSGGNLSAPASLTYTTGVSTPTVAKPKAPAVTTYLGTIKIAYDDLTASGLVQAGTAKEIEVYFSDVSGFTPGPSNYYGKFPANAGSYIIIPGTEIVDNTDYYIKILVRDIYGNITPASDQVSIRAKISDIVTFDMIDVGTLNGQVIIGLDMRTSPEPFNDGGIIMNKQGMTAYNPAGGQTFRIDAGTGAVFIGEYLGKQEAAGLYLGSSDAEQKYATIITANGISLTATTANTNATNALNTANTAKDNAETAITRIEAGTITVTKAKALGAINEGTANPTNTTTIEGGTIRTGSLNANRIGAGTIDASVITVTNINADNIEAGVLTGRRVQTASTGQRAVMQTGTFNRLELYNPSGVKDGYVSSTVNGAIFASEVSPGYVRLNVGGSSLNANASYRISLSTGGDFSVNSPRASSGGSSTLGSLSGISAKAYVFADLGGNLTASTSTAGVSDERVKTNISESPLGLQLIETLKPVQFNWIDVNDADEEEHRRHKQYGFIAQDVKAALDELEVDHAIVTKEPNPERWASAYPDMEISEDSPVLAIDQIQLIPALVKSIQELSARIKTLEAEIQDTKDNKNG